jgi:hypothetical protein
MVKIIGISGKKQSGKNTAANYIHGVILKSKNIIEDFEINEQGQLIIKTAVSGDEEYGVLDITRKDNNFVDYAHHKPMYAILWVIICSSLWNRRRKEYAV